MLSALNPAVPFGDPRFTLVDAETVDSFEVGAKTALMDRKLYLDAALFFISTRTSRRSSRSARPSSSPMPARPKATAWKRRFATTTAARCRLFANYAFNHARFKSGVLDGNRFRLAPEHTISAGLTWRRRRPGPPRFHAGGDLPIEGLLRRQQRHSGVAAAASHPAARLRPGRVSGRLCFGQRPGSATRSAGGKYRAELFVENLFDKEYIKDAGNSGDALGLPTFIAGEPRTYGIQLTARF